MQATRPPQQSRAWTTVSAGDSYSSSPSAATVLHTHTGRQP